VRACVCVYLLDDWKHLIVHAKRLLFIHRLKVNEMSEVLEKMLRYERNERSLEPTVKDGSL